MTGEQTFPLVLPDEEVTRHLAADVAAILRPGDAVTLTGDLGAGKTAFVRALIRSLADDETIEVPSPTFTLMQVYDLPPFPVIHADFYRLSTPSEVAEIGLGEPANDAVTLVEWPNRVGWLPANRLDLSLTLAPRLGPNFRRARLTGYGSLGARVERMTAIRRFLDESKFADAKREYLQGDASTRVYERLKLRDQRAVLMNAPRRPDGPAVRDGLPYSAIAHLAEDVRPFVAMANGLRDRGFSAPKIHAADLNAGLLILEDLGSDLIVAGDSPIEERYAAAVDVLVALHGEPLPAILPVAPHLDYQLPPYDLGAFMIEAELLLDWYLPFRGHKVDAGAHSEFVERWRAALAPAIAAAPTWVLRDYHSPNLLWLADRKGIARVGLLDFQDALMGPAAYDVVSLLQDARVDVPEAMEVKLLGRYARARHRANPEFDPVGFIALYAVLGAQRATKIMGIFARLNRRDGKPQYLRHLPRVWRNLNRSLSHASLAPLQAWYEANVPPPEPGQGNANAQT